MHLVEPFYPRGYYPPQPVTVVVQVTIAPDGTIAGGRVVQSAGNAAFDGSAVRSVEESTFAPKLVDCKPVEGTYLFKVTFRAH
jgi:TonB family protein